MGLSEVPDFTDTSSGITSGTTWPLATRFSMLTTLFPVLIPGLPAFGAGMHEFLGGIEIVQRSAEGATLTIVLGLHETNGAAGTLLRFV